MRLSDVLPLFEAITIEFDHIQKIKKFLTDLEPSMNNKTLQNKQQMFNILQGILNNIFHEYVNDFEYRIFLKIEESENKYGGNTYSTWQYNLNTDRYENTLTLILPKNNFNISQILSIISHELTHLIQSYRSSKKNIPNAGYSPNDGKKYFKTNHEIDAYAQSIASNIINKYTIKHISGQPSLNIIGIDNSIKYFQGMLNVPKNIPIFDFIKQHYDTYKNYFKEPSELNDIKVWRRLNKRIIQKLEYYKDTIDRKFGSIEYKVILDGDDYGSVFKPKDTPFKQFKSEMIKIYGDNGIILQKQKSKPSLP